MVKRKSSSLAKTKKEIQPFLMVFILVLILAVNPEPKMFSLRFVCFSAIAEHPKWWLCAYANGGDNLHMDLVFSFQACFLFFFKYLNLVSKTSEVRVISTEAVFLASNDCVPTWHMQSCTETGIKNKTLLWLWCSGGSLTIPPNYF